MIKPFCTALLAMGLALSACVALAEQPKPPELPKPFHTQSAVKFPKVVGWPDGLTPKAPEGFKVSRFAKLERPRWIYVLPNGDVLVAESRTEPSPVKKDDPLKDQAKKQAKAVGQSPNRITLLRDANSDGQPEVNAPFLTGLKQPFGMLLLGDTFYVANTNGVVKFPYQANATKIDAKGEQILELPAGGYNNHWTRNICASPDGKKLYVTVGSQTNVDEEGIDAKDPRRAAILECDPDGQNMRVFAAGLRNPNGLAWEPNTKALWTAVNERDGLGDDLVPDYVTSVKAGGFYGWPYSYFGQTEDPRKKGQRPDLVKQALVPDLPVGSHTASLGLLFYTAQAFPEKFQNGLFIGQRGSWNRSKFSGYRVAFAPFKDGKPTGAVEDFLTGFIKNDDEVYGQPVGIAVAKDGALLVADETGGCVWRVAKAQ